MKTSGQLSAGVNGSQWLTCRVQYLDDTDPFQSTNFPEPTRPPSYTFNVDKPLCEQLAGIHRLLKAPHKVSIYAALEVSLSIVASLQINGFGEKRIYLFLNF